jgi:hypothetical protein
LAAGRVGAKPPLQPPPHAVPGSLALTSALTAPRVESEWVSASCLRAAQRCWSHAAAPLTAEELHAVALREEKVRRAALPVRRHRP